MNDLLAPEEAAQAAIDALLADPNDWAAKFLAAWPENYFAVGPTCQAAGVHPRTFHARLKHDSTFAALYDDLVDQAKDAIRSELHRRAIDGIERPVYQGGRVVGSITEYDNKHLEWLAERLMPEEYHLPLRIEFARPDEADFVFRMGESDIVELPPGSVTDSEDA